MKPLFRSGYTLVEVLMVIAILSVLMGILLPVLISAKARSGETACTQNLHQLQLALAIYRSNNDGDGQFGKASQMGLVPDKVSDVVALRLPLKTFRCNAPSNAITPEGAVYGRRYSDQDPMLGRMVWSDYVKEEGELSVVYVDMNHGDRSVPLFSPMSAHKAIAVRLSGQAFTRTAVGNWTDYSWWLTHR